MRRARAATSGSGVGRRAGRELAGGELADVEHQQHAAVAVDGGAGHGGQPAEEAAELLDDDLALALELVDREGEQLAGGAVVDDDGGTRRRARR